MKGREEEVRGGVSEGERGNKQHKDLGLKSSNID